MGLFRARGKKPSRLPIYEKPRKARVSDDEDYYASEDSESFSDASTPSYEYGSSAQSSRSSSAMMLPKKNQPASVTRPGRIQFYRLPNKVVRYMCFTLVLLIVGMILTLVRASQVENQRVAEGKVIKKPDPPPVWEQFDFLTRYYGGIRELVPFSKNIPQYPASDDEIAVEDLDIDLSVNKTSEDGVDDLVRRGFPESKVFSEHPKSVFKAKQEQVKECFLDPENELRVPPVRFFDGRPKGFPRHVLGSYELFDLPEEICYERYGRYGPYGFGYSTSSGGLGVGEHGEMEGSQLVWEGIDKIDYREVDWADAQRRCFQANADRYKPLPEKRHEAHGFFIDDGARADSKPAGADKNNDDEKSKRSDSGDDDESQEEKPADEGKIARTAVVIRAWDEYLFRADDILNIRSIITELSLASGGRYDVHLLVQVKNDAQHPIWADQEAYEQRIKDAIPKEFRGLVTLWTETQMLSLYQGINDLFSSGPDLPVHGVYRGLSMAMQYFAYQHPEYEYYWSWEMDIRYTGHHYDLFSKLEDWAREQPRKGLWERSSRFYLPDVHGSWEDFRQMTRVQAEMGTTTADNIWDDLKKDSPSGPKGEKPIWGPQRPQSEDDWFDTENDPEPPTTAEKDKGDWGVGEEADLIAMNPIFDPEGTTWLLADDITGYNRTEGLPPRRAHIVTASRLSRRLLLTMHRETAYKKHFAFPEMWPATVAFHHGFKAVFAPHPQFVDREWPVEYLGQVLNAGKNGASGGARTSVFGQREHNLRGLTWFYNSGFGPNLYRRWLGLKGNNDGGEEFELVADESRNDTSVTDMKGGEGRMCLPPMLIHPVKEIDLPVESPPEEDKDDELPESDPNA